MEGKMIIRTSDQVPRVTALKRFPVPRNFGMAPASQTERAKVEAAISSKGTLQPYG
jgi:hypothetical protein